MANIFSGQTKEKVKVPYQNPAVAKIEPKKVDVFDAIYGQGIDPLALPSYLKQSDQIGISSLDQYKERYAELYQQDPEAFEKKFDVAASLAQDLNVHKEYLPELFDEEKPQSFARMNKPSAFSANLLKENKFQTIGRTDSNAHVSVFSPSQRLSQANKYVDLTGEQPRLVNMPVTRAMRMRDTFIDYVDPETGEEMWAKVPQDGEYYGHIIARPFGDQKRTSVGIAEFGRGLAGGMSVGAFKSLANFSKMVQSIPAIWKEEDPEIVGEKFFNEVINSLSKYTPEQSYSSLDEGPLKNSKQFWFGMGDMIGQLLPQIGVSMAGGPVSGIAYATAIATGSVYENAKAMGLDESDAVKLGLLSSLGVGLTEGILGQPWITKWFASSNKKILESIYQKNLAKLSGKAVSKGAASGVTGKELGEVAKNITKEYAQAAKQWRKRLTAGEIALDNIPFLSGAVREGTQEGLEEAWYYGIENLYNQWSGDDKPKYDTEGFGERFAENFVLGALAGGVMSVRTKDPYKRDLEDHINNMILHGETEEAIDAVKQMRDRGKTGLNVTRDGKTVPEGYNAETHQQNPITDHAVVLEKGEFGWNDGDVLATQNDLNAYNLMKQIQMQDKLATLSGVKNNKGLKVMAAAGDEAFSIHQFRNGIQKYKELEQKEKVVADIQERLDAIEDPEKKKAVKKELNDAIKEKDKVQEKLNDMVLPEEGSMFSKTQNNFAKLKLGAFQYANEGIKEIEEQNGKKLTGEERTKKKNDLLQEYHKTAEKIYSANAHIKDFNNYFETVREEARASRKNTKKNRKEFADFMAGTKKLSEDLKTKMVNQDSLEGVNVKGEIQKIIDTMNTYQGDNSLGLTEEEQEQYRNDFEDISRTLFKALTYQRGQKVSQENIDTMNERVAQLNKKQQKGELTEKQQQQKEKDQADIEQLTAELNSLYEGEGKTKREPEEISDAQSDLEDLNTRREVVLKEMEDEGADKDALKKEIGNIDQEIKDKKLIASEGLNSTERRKSESLQKKIKRINERRQKIDDQKAKMGLDAAEDAELERLEAQVMRDAQMLEDLTAGDNELYHNAIDAMADVAMNGTDVLAQMQNNPYYQELQGPDKDWSNAFIDLQNFIAESREVEAQENFTRRAALDRENGFGSFVNATDQDLLKKAFLAELNKYFDILDAIEQGISLGIGLETVENLVANIHNYAKVIRNAAEFDSEIVEKRINRSSNPMIREHLSDNDIPLSEETYLKRDKDENGNEIEGTSLKERIDNLEKEAREKQEAIEALLGSRARVGRETHILKIEAKRKGLEFLKSALNITDAEFIDALAAIPALTTEEKEGAVPSDEEYKTRVVEAESAIFKARLWIHKNKDLFFKDSTIDKFSTLKGTMYQSINGSTTDPVQTLRSDVIDTEANKSNTIKLELLSLIEESLAFNPYLLENEISKIEQEDAKNDTEEAPKHASSFEQRSAIRQLASFALNKELTWIPKYLEREYIWAHKNFESELGRAEADAHINQKKKAFRKNIINVIGEAAGGKSVQILPVALKVVTNLTGGKSIAVVTPSTELKSSLDNYLSENQKLTIKHISPTQYNESELSSIDFVIWDEAGLISEEDIHRVIDKNNIPKIFLGDVSQMTDFENNKYSFSPLEEMAFKTSTLSVQFAANPPMIRSLAYAMREYGNSESRNNPVRYPKMKSKIENGKRQGGKYYANLSEVFKDFVESQNSNKALVFYDKADLEQAVKTDPEILKHKDKIYFLKPDLFKKNPTFKVKGVDVDNRTIQGLRKEEVYLGSNFNNHKANMSPILFTRIAYTGITRASDFIGIIAPGVNATQDSEVSFKAQDDVKVNMAKSSAYDVSQAVSSSILNDPANKYTEGTPETPQKATESTNEEVPAQDTEEPVRSEYKPENAPEESEDFSYRFNKGEIHILERNGERFEVTIVESTNGSLVIVKPVNPDNGTEDITAGADELANPLSDNEQEHDQKEDFSQKKYNSSTPQSVNGVEYHPRQIMYDSQGRMSPIAYFTIHPNGKLTMTLDSELDKEIDSSAWKDHRLPEVQEQPSEEMIKSESLRAFRERNGDAMWGTLYTAFDPNGNVNKDNVTEIRRLKAAIMDIIGDHFILEYHSGSSFYMDDGSVSEDGGLVLKVTDAAKAKIKDRIDKLSRRGALKEIAQKEKGGQYGQALYYVSALSFNDSPIEEVRLKGQELINLAKEKIKLSGETSYTFEGQMRTVQGSFQAPRHITQSTNRDANAFLTEMEKKGFDTDNRAWRVTKGKNTNGNVEAQAIILDIHMGKSSFSVFANYPRVNQYVKKADLEKLIKEDIQHYESILVGGQMTNKEANQVILSSFLSDLLKNNRASLESTTAGKDLIETLKKEGLIWDDKGIFFWKWDEKSNRKRLESYQKIANAFLDIYENHNAVKQMIYPFKLNFDGKGDKKSNYSTISTKAAGRPVREAMNNMNHNHIQVRYSDIHFPSAYFVFDDTAATKQNDGYSPFLTRARSTSATMVKENQAVEFIGKLLGKNGELTAFNEEDINGLFDSEVLAYMKAGRIALKSFEGKVYEDALRHEASHIAFNYILSESARGNLKSEIEQMEGRSMTYKEIDEYIAEKAQETTGLELDRKNGLWENLKRLVKVITQRLGLYAPTLQGYLDDLNSGVFRQMKMNRVEDTSLVRAMTEEEVETKLFGKRDGKFRDIHNFFDGNDTRISRAERNINWNIRQFTTISGNKDVEATVPKAIQRAYNTLTSQKKVAEYGRKEVQLNSGEVVSVKDVTDINRVVSDDQHKVDMFRIVSNKEMLQNMILYNFPSFNFKKGKFYSKQENFAVSEEGQQQISNYVPDVVDLMIETTIQYKYYPEGKTDANGTVVVAKNSLDLENADKFIDSKKMTKHLNDAGMNVERMINEGDLREPVDLFIEELNKIADKIGDDGEKQSRIKSFIREYLSNFVNGKDISLYGQIQQDFVNNKVTAQTLNKLNFINAILSIAQNTQTKRTIDIKIDRIGNKLVSKIIDRHGNTVVSNTKAIQDLVHGEFTNSSSAINAKKGLQLLDQNRNGKPNSRQRFVIEHGGIKRKTRGEESSYLIQRTSTGNRYKYSFGNGMYINGKKENGIDMQALDSILSYLGIYGAGNRKPFKQMAKNVDVKLQDFLREVGVETLGYGKTTENEEFLAEGFYNIMNSIKLHQMVNDIVLNKMQEYKDENPDLSDDRYMEELENIRENAYNDAMRWASYVEINKYMERLKVKSTLRDERGDINSEDEFEEPLKKTVLPVPASFYNFFALPGLINVYNRGDEANAMTFDLAGSGWYYQQMNNDLFKIAGDGTNGLQKQYRVRMEIALEEEGVDPESVSPMVIMDNGEARMLNPFLFDSGMSIRSMQQLRSIAHIKSTNDLRDSDLVLASAELFLDGIKGNIEKLRIPIRNIGDSSTLAFIEANWSTGLETTLFRGGLVYDNFGNIKKARLNNDGINERLDLLFEKNMRMQEFSLDNLIDWISSYKSGDIKGRSFLKNVKRPEKYSPKAFNSYLKDKKMMVDKALADLSIAVDPKDLIRSIQASNVLNGVYDYQVSENGLSLGRAGSLNDRVINNDNIEKWFDSKDKTKTRRSFFGKDMIRTFVEMAQSGGIRTLRDQLKNMEGFEGSTYMFKKPTGTQLTQEELEEKGFELVEDEFADENIQMETEYNPILEGMYMSYFIYNNHLDDFLPGGNWMHHNSNQGYSKRSITAKTPKQNFVFTKFGIGPTSWSITKKTISENSSYFSKDDLKNIDLRDGEGVGNPLWLAFAAHNLGDDFSNFRKNAARKTLYNDTNILTGKSKTIKHAVDFIDNDTFDNNLEYRNLFFAMLEITDKKVKAINPNYEENYLANQFNKHYKGNFEEAVQKMVLDIFNQENSIYEDIRNNIVWQVGDETTDKFATSGISDFDSSNKIDVDGLTLNKVETNKIGEILNAESDPSNIEGNLTRPNQQTAYISMDGNLEKDANGLTRSDRIKNLLNEMFEAGQKEIEAEVNSMPVRSDLKDKRLIRIAKMDAFLRRKGIDMVKASGIGGTFSDVIFNRNLSMDLPGIRERIINTYRNYINHTAINRKMNGVRAVQLDGSSFLLFKDENGNIFLPKDIEKRYKKELQEKYNRSLLDMSDLTKVDDDRYHGQVYSFEIGGKKFTVTRPQPMKPGQSGEVIVGFSHAEKYGLQENETLADLFTLKRKNGEYVDLRGLARNQIDKIIREVILNDDYEIDESPAIRKTIEDLFDQRGEEALQRDNADMNNTKIKRSVNYIVSLQKLLFNVYTNRVPANRLGSGDVNTVVGIVKDTNKVYMPPENVLLNDSDYDIDMKAVYYLDINKEFKVTNEGFNGKANDLLNMIMDIYRDPINEQSIYYGTDVDYLIDQGNKADMSKNKKMYHANSLGQRFDDYAVNTAGKQAISLLATFNSSLGVLAQIDQSYLKGTEFEGINLKAKIPGRRSIIAIGGDYLQLALDNANLGVLGQLGITLEGVPLLEGMIINETLDEGVHDRIREFFANPVVRNVLKSLAYRQSVLGKSSIYDKFTVTRQAINKAETLITGGGLPTITDKGFNDAVEALRDELNNTKPSQLTEDERKDYYKKLDQLKAVNDYQILNQMMDYFITGEKIRRFAKVVSLRNGMNVTEMKHHLYNKSMEEYLGMTGKEFIDRKRNKSPEERINYWKQVNEDYRFADRKGEEESDVTQVILDVETEIQNSFKLFDIIKDVPYLNSYLEEHFDNSSRFEGLFALFSGPLLKNVENIIADKGMTKVKFAYQRRALGEAVSQAMIDLYFKKHAPGTVDLRTTTLERDIDNNPIVDINQYRNRPLKSDINRRLMFELWFPQYVKWLLNIQALDEGNALMELIAAGKTLDEATEIYKHLKENPFFNSIHVEQGNNRSSVRLINENKITSDEIAFLRQQFNTLPKELRKAFAYSQLINNGLSWSGGKMVDVVSSEFIHEMSDVMNEFNDILSKTRSNTKIGNYSLMRIFKGINDYLMADPNFMNYMSQKELISRIKHEDFRIKSFKRYEKMGERYHKVMPYYQNEGQIDPVYKVSKGIDLDRVTSDLTQPSNFSLLEMVRNFDVDETNTLLKAARAKDRTGTYSVLKEYPIYGHNYKNGYYMTPQGLIIKAEVMSPTAVRFTKSEVSYEEALENQTARREKEAKQREADAKALKEKGLLGIYTSPITPMDKVRKAARKAPMPTIEDMPLDQQDSRALPDRMVQRTTGMSFNELIRHLEKKHNVKWLQGVKVDSDGNPVHSWVSGGNVYYDEDAMTLDSPLHEMGHLWLNAMKSLNKPVYDAIINRVKAMKDRVIHEYVAETYPELGGKDLLDEIAVTLFGLNSQEKVNDWMLKHDVHEQGWAKRMWQRLQDWINYVRDSFRKLFRTFSTNLQEVDIFNDSLDKIFGALALDFLSGNGNIDPISGKHFVLSAFGSRVQDSRSFGLKGYDLIEVSPKFKEDKRINDIKDYVTFLADHADTGLTKTEMNSDGYRKFIWFSSKRQESNGKVKYVYSRFGIEQEFTEEEFNDKDKFNSIVNQNVLEPLMTLDRELGASLASLIEMREDLSEEDLLAEIESTFTSKNGNKQIDARAIKQALDRMEIKDGIHSVMRYKDLKNSSNEKLRALYQDGFEGMNNLVIVHSMSNNKLEVSLIDPTITPTGSVGLGVRGHGLNSVIQTDKDFYRQGGRLDNKMGNIRRMLLTMQMMSLKKQAENKNLDLRVRSMGVMQFTGQRASFWMVPDINFMLKHIEIFNEVNNQLASQGKGSLTSRVDNKAITDIITDKDLLEADYYTSYIDRLKRLENVNERIDSETKAALTSDPNRPEFERAIRRRMSQILNYYRGGNIEDAYENFEFFNLSMALREVTTGQIGFVNDVSDMQRISRHILNPYNVNSEINQYVNFVANRVQRGIVEKTSNYMEDMADVTERLIEFKKSNVGSYLKIAAQQAVSDAGALFFENMFKVAYMKDGSQKRLPYIHWDLKDPETAFKFNNKELDQVELDYANKFLDWIEKSWIEMRMHEAKKTGEAITEEEAKRMFHNQVGRGWVPVIEKSANELLTRGKFKQAVPKMLENIGSSEKLFMDNRNTEGDKQYLSKVMFDDLSKNEDLLGKSGLHHTGEVKKLENGVEVAIYDSLRPELNERMGNNLQNTGNYFRLATIRKIDYENDFLPHYNAAQSMYQYIEMMGKTQKYNREFLDDLVQRLVYNQNRDGDDSFDVLGIKMKPNEMVRTFLHGTSFLSLAFKPVIWAKSFVYNELNSAINAISISIADKLAAEENANNFYGAKEYIEAHRILGFTKDIGNIGTNFKKARALAYMFQIIESTERDMLESPMRVRTDRNIFQEKFAHVGNWATDAYARMISMVAQMIKEGSWEAYSYDPQSGKVVYNEKKDMRWYDENGNAKTSKGEHALRAHLLQRLQEQGIQENGDKLERGHDHDLANVFLYLSNKFVIGSMDQRNKSVIGQHYLGQAFSQYRWFAWDRLQLAGLGMGGAKRMSIDGVGYKAVQLEDGTWMSVKDIQHIEGIFQSWGSMISDVFRYRNMTMKEYWNYSPQRRMNIVKSLMQTGFTTILLGLLKNFVDDDEKDKFLWLATETMMLFLGGSMILSPFAAISTLTNLVNVLLGKRGWKFMAYYLPFSQIFELPEMVKSLFDKEYWDDIRLTQKEKEKIQELKQKSKEEAEKQIPKESE